MRNMQNLQSIYGPIAYNIMIMNNRTKLWNTRTRTQDVIRKDLLCIEVTVH
jgi:hypothetical protein